MLYRIEKNGIGPYNYQYIYKDENIKVSDWAEPGHLSRTMPVPAEDAILGKICKFLEKVGDKHPFDLVFCFLSESDVLKYFTKTELEKLENLGFNIINFGEASFFKVLYGETQAVGFKTEEAYNYYLELLDESAKTGFIPYF